MKYLSIFAKEMFNIYPLWTFGADYEPIGAFASFSMVL